MFAIVEFGSLTRKEDDPFSDRDLLIVCPSEYRKDYLNRYEKEGYSVSILTERQLFFMKEKGALFLQHLRLESKVIVDSDFEFTSFINTCKLVKPNITELDTCQKSIEYLSAWSNSPELSAWKADFLFCLSRDYLIKRLAMEGVVAFGLKDIERIAKDIFMLRKDDFMFLSILRKVKAAYRSDCQFPEEFEIATKQWLMALNRAFDFQNVVDSYKKINVRKIIPHKFHTPYEQLRTLEGLYLIARNMGYSHSKHQLIMNLIQRPNFYGSAKKANQKAIRKILNDVELLIVNKAMKSTSFPLRYTSLENCH